MLSTRVQSLGGRSTEGSGLWGEGASHTGGGVWETAILCFVISKWRIFVNFGVLNLKFFFLYRELRQWGSSQFCGKFWIFEQSNAWIKDIIKCCHWVRTTNIGLLYPKVGYVIILGGYCHWCPPTKILVGMCPRHPRRGWRQCASQHVVNVKCQILSKTFYSRRRRYRIWIGGAGGSRNVRTCHVQQRTLFSFQMYLESDDSSGTFGNCGSRDFQTAIFVEAAVFMGRKDSSEISWD